MDIRLAGNGTQGALTTRNLFAGESDIVTTSSVYKAGVAFPEGAVLAKDADGKLILWAQGVGAPENSAVGICPLQLDSAAADRQGPYYTGGVFNHAALVWPVAADTLVERKAAFERTNIVIDTVLG